MTHRTSKVDAPVPRAGIERADRLQLVDMLETTRGELADGRHELQHTLEVARATTWSVDLTSHRIEWSPNAHHVLGLAPGAPIDTLSTFFGHVVPEDARRLQAMVADADRGDDIPWEWELRIEGHDGVTRWFSGRGMTMADPSAVRISGVTFDITEQRQLEAQLRDREQMLSGLVAASPDGIVVSGLGGRIRFASDGIFDVVGMRPEELIDRHTWEFVEPELHAHLLDSTIRLRTDPSGIEQVRLRLLHRRGHVVTVECRMRLLTDATGHADGFVIVVRDVSDQVRLESELARARDQAEAANRAKSDYLSRMSHELRTPMNSVLGFAQLLELAQLAPEDHDSVDRILGAGRHLLQLIDDVLDIARVEAGRFTIALAPVSVEDVVRVATDLLRPQLSSAALQLSVDVGDPAWIVADRKRVSQVLINLLSNAIKYNRPGGSVSISCSQPRAGWHRLSVSDTGDGIADELQPQLFGAFERLGADRSDVPGTGLGLALSRTLMEAMGGQLGCDSVLGVGSTFWLELPTAPTGPRPTGSDPTPPAGTALASTMRTN